MNKESILEDNIVHKALERLEDVTGLKGKWETIRQKKDMEIDGKIIFDLPHGKQAFYVEVKRILRKHQVDQVLFFAAKYDHFILVADYIFPAVKEVLRQHKIGYLDGAGNLYINSNGQLIWIEGNKPLKKGKQLANRAFTKAGLKVLFFLLTHENALQMTYREIAAKAHVSLGNINLVLAGLKEAGFLLQLNKKESMLQNKKELLDRWINGYHETLKPALHQGNFRLDKTTGNSWRDLTIPSGDVWGGEAAGELLTDYLNARILTVYTDKPQKELMKDWKLIPDAGGQVQVYQKFWKDELNTYPDIAPYLLIYTDLILTQDPRCIETAKLIYNKHLKEIYKLT